VESGEWKYRERFSRPSDLSNQSTQKNTLAMTNNNVSADDADTSTREMLSSVPKSPTEQELQELVVGVFGFCVGNNNASHPAEFWIAILFYIHT
jgi:hypothetical protein